MSAQIYKRLVVTGFVLLIGLTIAAPHLVIGGAHAACGGHIGDGCGDVGLVFLMLGVIPMLAVILIFIGWTIFRRVRFLQLPSGYAVLTSFLVAGCLQSCVVGFFAGRMGLLTWEIGGPPLMTILIGAVLYYIPEPCARRYPSPLGVYAFIAVSVIMLARLATAILYPLSILPGGLQLSSAIIGFSRPLNFLPIPLVFAAFAILLLVLLKQWRNVDGPIAPDTASPE